MSKQQKNSNTMCVVQRLTTVHSCCIMASHPLEVCYALFSRQLVRGGTCEKSPTLMRREPSTLSVASPLGGKTTSHSVAHRADLSQTDFCHHPGRQRDRSEVAPLLWWHTDESVSLITLPALVHPARLRLSPRLLDYRASLFTKPF